MGVHPYRQPAEPRESVSESDPPWFDAEECVVHGVIAIVGLIGIVVGLSYGRATELALGGLLTLFVVRVLWRGGV